MSGRRCGNVDGIDVGVGNQVLRIVVPSADVMLVGKIPGVRLGAAHDGNYFGLRERRKRRDSMPLRGLTATDKAPFYGLSLFHVNKSFGKFLEIGQMENGLLCGFRECRIEIGQNLIGTFFGLQCAKVRFFSYICTHIHYFLFANERPHTDFGRYTPPYKALDEDTVETFFRVCSSRRGIPDLCFCTAGIARHFRQRHGFVRLRRYFGPACSPVYRCPCAGAGVMHLGRCFRLQSLLGVELSGLLLLLLAALLLPSLILMLSALQANRSSVLLDVTHTPSWPYVAIFMVSAAATVLLMTTATFTRACFRNLSRNNKAETVAEG